MTFLKNKEALIENGFSISAQIYSDQEIKEIINFLENIDSKSDSIIITKDLFAIRQLLKVAPQLKSLIFNTSMNQLIQDVGGSDFFLTKAIYFNKPKTSNWFVSYHQDLSISVEEKHEIEGFKNWTSKRNQVGVQPPLEILENIITIRIHLDDTTKDNGALKVIPREHTKGVTLTKELQKDNEVVCSVKKGAVMLMKPLTPHASNRTTNDKQRRVIHLEFSNKHLPAPMKWLEMENVF